MNQRELAVLIAEINGEAATYRECSKQTKHMGGWGEFVPMNPEALENHSKRMVEWANKLLKLFPDKDVEVEEP